MACLLAEAEIRQYIEEIDNNIDLLDSMLRQEIARIKKAVSVYQQRINGKQFHEEHVMYEKLRAAFALFDTIERDSQILTELLDSITHLKQVNKLLLFALGYSTHQLVSLSVFVSTISNVCLAQLKHIRTQYDSVLRQMREKVITVWMDRDVANSIRLILFINQQQFKKFLQVLKHAEVHYADLSINSLDSDARELHEHIVLRMISNRLTAVNEQRIIHTLFPQWEYSTISE